MKWYPISLESFLTPSHAFQTCSSNSAPDMRDSLAGRTVRDVGSLSGVGCRGSAVSLQLTLRPRWRNTGSLPPPALLLREAL